MYRVNAVTVSCVRTVKETKKKILDSQSNVKKKEAFRKRVAARIGGGPYFAVSFKPWELIVSTGNRQMFIMKTFSSNILIKIQLLTVLNY